jgi:DNA-binding response OmpR family regulator
MHIRAGKRPWRHLSCHVDESNPVAPKVHIIEDDPAIRDSLKLFLESRGYSVTTFGSGSELFNGLTLAPCDCLILDVNLPGDDGFEILAKLRRAGVQTPAIFMSGRASAATRVQAVRANAVAYFDKPVPPRELLAAVASATSRK